MKHQIAVALTATANQLSYGPARESMDCDRIAGAYRWIERSTFGRALESARFHFLDDLSAARQALILGDGDGRFLEQLLSSSPQVEADYIDLSAGMVQQARMRAGASRVHFRQGDARCIPLDPQRYDLIATHFFLDCFGRTDLELLARRIHAASKPGARWVVSEFREPTGWMRLPARGLIGTMYRFFRIATGLQVTHLTDHRPILSAAGFDLTQQESRLGGLVTSELWSKQGPASGS